jgi:cytochrome c-type biogenesis protein CcmF
LGWFLVLGPLHSLAVTEKRAQFKAWTMLLAIGAFSLSLIGTFLVRSGVLTSVHAFAVDPTRGRFILIFLACVIGGSLLLFLLRAHSVRAKEGLHAVSRESALLLNNVFLVVLMLTVLLGTIYPLIVDGLGLGKLSVGAPYFNEMFVPLFAPMLVLMGLAVHVKWGKDEARRLWSKVSMMALLCLILPAFLLFVVASKINYFALLGLILSFWVIGNTLYHLWLRIKERSSIYVGQAYIGMVLAHCGVAICVIGVSMSVNYGQQDDVVMQPGSVAHLNGNAVHFVEKRAVQGPNYQSTQAMFQVSHGSEGAVIYPEKRRYNLAQSSMTEAAIDASIWRDIYIALGEPLKSGAWSVRIYYKPMVRWIWGGGFLIFLGGIFALADKRYYKKKATECALYSNERGAS